MSDHTIDDFNKRRRENRKKTIIKKRSKGTWVNLSFDDWERLQYKKLYSPDEVEEEGNNEETQEDT